MTILLDSQTGTKSPTLTEKDIDQEYILAKGSPQKKKKFLEKFLNRVESLANKYANKSSMSYNELVSEGYLGLERAFGSFSVDKGKFSSYAPYWIKKYILAAISKNRTVRVASNISDTYNKIKRLEGQSLSTFQIQSELKLTAKRYEKIVETMHQPVSITLSKSKNNENSEGVFNLADTSSNPVNLTIQKETQEQVHTAVGHLREKEKQVIDLRYKRDLKLREIAEIMDISIQYVQKLLSDAIKKLQKELV